MWHQKVLDIIDELILQYPGMMLGSILRAAESGVEMGSDEFVKIANTPF
mgnify:CR=1 FL=1